MKTRSPFFRHLAKTLQQANRAAVKPPVVSSASRRRFLKNSLALGTGLGLGATAIRCEGKKSDPQVAIIGAGLAGLTAGYYLKKGKIPCTIYEASSRVGGRVFTLKDFAAPGTWSELGGQYIDTSHHSILDLCKELQVPLLDVEAPGELALVQLDYFFNGKRYTDKDIIEEYRSLAPIFEKDIASFTETVGYKTPQFKALDNLTLEVYIEQSGASPLMKQLLNAAFTCEYGRDLGEQSSLNMIYLLPPKINGDRFEVWGESDERYVIEGGNSTLPEKLTGLLEAELQLEQALVAVTENGSGYTLSFESGKEVKADAVIFALPFSMLRKIDLRVTLPPQKQQAIRELGYGWNSKMALGFDRRVWREQGFTGNVFNETLQNAWEHTQMQNNNEGQGGFTVFLGGQPGKNLSADRHTELVGTIDQIYPGSQAAYNNKRFLFNWSTNVYVQGSYTCYLPGQWTAFGGAEAEPVGNLYFAGEHCSHDSQGFMDGAVETGKLAAATILEKLG